jgi:hypothetical protein
MEELASILQKNYQRVNDLRVSTAEKSAQLAQAQEKLLIAQTNYSLLEIEYSRVQSDLREDIFSTLRNAAMDLRNRNRLFELRGEALFDKSRLAQESEVIRIYEEAKQSHNNIIVKALQAEYEQAQQHLQVGSNISAGIYIEEKDSSLDVYLTASLADSQSGLMARLVDRFLDSVIISECEIETPREINDLMYIEVKGTLASLVNTLHATSPLFWEEARVTYELVTLPLLAPSNEENTPISKSNDDFAFMERNDPSLPENKVYHFDEVPDQYLYLDDAAALANLNRTTIQHAIKDGYIAGIKATISDVSGQRRLVEKSTLLNYIATKRKNIKTANSSINQTTKDIATQLPEGWMLDEDAAKVLGYTCKTSLYGPKEAGKLTSKLIQLSGRKKPYRCYSSQSVDEFREEREQRGGE